MAIDFPASPTVGQVFIFGTTTYIWDGTKWTSSAANSPFSLGSASTPSITFIGDTNTGIYSPGADQVSITTGGTERFRFDSTGQLESVSLGTAAAPAFSFTTDPDTGLYSPGANQVAISTNGTGRLFVDGAGDVGVNYNAPGDGGSKFQVEGNIGLGGLDETQVLSIGRVDSGATNPLANISMFGAGTNDFKGTITFSTNSAGFFNSSCSERLRITSAGLVGIGTSSPGAGLDVISIGQTSSALNTGGSLNTIISDTGGLAGNGGSLVFAANSGAWRFASIKGLVTNGSNNTQGDLAFSTRQNATDSTLTERLRITAAGSVGIGTTSPATLLDVTKTSAGADANHLVLKNESSTSGTTVSLYFQPNNSGISRAAAIKGINPGSAGFPNATELAFFTQPEGNDPIERCRVDKNGRLLVGTSSARSFFSGADVPALQIEGTTTQGRELSITSSTNTVSGGVVLLGKQRSGTLGGNTIVQNNDQIGYLGYQASDGTNMVAAAAITAEVDGTPGANDMPARLVFSTTADGASSPTERMRIDSSGRLLVGTSSGSAKTVINGDLKVGGTVFSTKYSQSSPIVFTITAPTGAGNVPRMFTLRAVQCDFSSANIGSGEWVYRFAGAASSNVAVLRSNTDGTVPTITVANVNSTTFTVSVAFTRQQCNADISAIDCSTIV